MGLARNIGKSDLVRQFPGRWMLYWLLLPNLGIILMWPIGGPPMRVGLVLFSAGAFVASQLPWRGVKMVALAVLSTVVATLYICNTFAIPSLNFPLIWQFLKDVRPLHSPEYLVAGAVILGSTGLAMHRAPSVPCFSQPLHYLFALLAIFAFINFDTRVTAGTASGYHELPGPGARFDSAVSQVKLKPSRAKPHHVLVVIVEALGEPAAPQEKALFAADWDRPEWRKRYQVSHGHSLYYGSTTNGELRELCGVWANYTSFDFGAADCVPEHFRDAGYRTVSYHNFSGSLFQRLHWYPRIGLSERVFGEELLQGGAALCDGVFPGACDADVGEAIAQRLAQAREPQFVYWLTLNSHLPIKGEVGGGENGCMLGTPEWREAFPMLCRLFQAHHEVADAISRLALSSDTPPTDILIVGDHKPPFFDRLSRQRFDPDHVPWIYLRAKEAVD